MEPGVITHGFYNFGGLHHIMDGTICKLYHYGVLGLGLTGPGWGLYHFGDGTIWGLQGFGDFIIF